MFVNCLFPNSVPHLGFFRRAKESTQSVHSGVRSERVTGVSVASRLERKPSFPEKIAILPAFSCARACMRTKSTVITMISRLQRLLSHVSAKTQNDLSYLHIIKDKSQYFARGVAKIDCQKTTVIIRVYFLQPL